MSYEDFVGEVESYLLTRGEHRLLRACRDGYDMGKAVMHMVALDVAAELGTTLVYCDGERPVELEVRKSPTKKTLLKYDELMQKVKLISVPSFAKILTSKILRITFTDNRRGRFTGVVLRLENYLGAQPFFIYVSLE